MNGIYLYNARSSGSTHPQNGKTFVGCWVTGDAGRA